MKSENKNFVFLLVLCEESTNVYGERKKKLNFFEIRKTLK